MRQLLSVAPERINTKNREQSNALEVVRKYLPTLVSSGTL